MPRKPYMPQTVEGIEQMLTAFDTNINANSKALATKYGVDAAALTRVTQAHLVWEWFGQATAAARAWTVSVTETRDMMHLAPQGDGIALPGGPALPAIPQLAGPPPVNVEVEPGFFTFFTGLVAEIKNNQSYDEVDGRLLGIEGAEQQPPNPANTIPHLAGEIFTGGHPELTCKKGPFQGFDVWLTRPDQPKKQIGFSTARHFNVTEPLPATGAAEVWTFEAQYRYQNKPFGRLSQPLSLTVRG